MCCQFGADRLKGLVLIDTAPAGIGKDRSKEWVFFSADDADGFRKWGTQGVLTDRAKFNEEFARWMVSKPTENYVKWITRIMNSTASGTAALLNESSAYQDYSQTLRELERKTSLLYYGNPDNIKVVENWAKVNTPSASVKLLSKHMFFSESAESFNKDFDHYLATIAP